MNRRGEDMIGRKRGRRGREKWEKRRRQGLKKQGRKRGREGEILEVTGDGIWGGGVRRQRDNSEDGGVRQARGCSSVTAHFAEHCSSDAQLPAIVVPYSEANRGDYIVA